MTRALWKWQIPFIILSKEEERRESVFNLLPKMSGCFIHKISILDYEDGIEENLIDCA
ncbi:MAG TPA: hypothetical protein VGK38_05250 [Prolixibacteraceae bacterium]